MKDIDKRLKLIAIILILSLSVMIIISYIENKSPKNIQRNESLNETSKKNIISEEGTNVVVYNDDFPNGSYDQDWIVESKNNGIFFNAPTSESDGLKFTVQEGAWPGDLNSLSKIYFKERNKLSYGTYTSKFMINRVPTEHDNAQIYFGMGLWQFGANGLSNEVMMGFYLIYNQKAKRWDDRLQVLSRDNGSHSKVSSPDIKASAFVNTYHTIKFIYTPDNITGFLDDQPVLEKTDNIPSVPMSFIIGTRIASGEPLDKNLDVTFDYVGIHAELYNESSGVVNSSLYD